jgi:sugar phosphate isomerase/epimerase
MPHPLVLAPSTIPNSPPLAYIEAAARAGYQWIGLRLNASPGLPYHPVVGDAALIRAMKQAIAAGGLTVLDIYSFYLVPDVNVGAFAPALDLAAELGAKYAVTMGADTDWSRMRENFERLCDLAAGRGLVCAIEPAVIRPLANLPQTLALIAEAKRANAAICVDPLNFVRAGDTAADLALVDPKLLPYAQITDGMILPGEPNPAMLGRMPANQRRLMGEGMVPVAEILDVLPAGLPLSVEFPPPDAATDERAWAALVHGNVRAWLDRYDARSPGRPSA